MIACLDADYRSSHALAACVLADAWTSSAPADRLVARVESVSDYAPGRFFERELPCLRAVLALVRGPLEAAIVDGCVWLDGRPGLGAHLFEALGRTVPVVGVAKTPFRGAEAKEIRRGLARRPLYVTAAGLDPDLAAARIREMHDPFRVPTLLREVDRLCRTSD